MLLEQERQQEMVKMQQGPGPRAMPPVSAVRGVWVMERMCSDVRFLLRYNKLFLRFLLSQCQLLSALL